MWKIHKLDEQLFDGAEAKIYEYLDVSRLMPPKRLALSQKLGRPLMSQRWHEAVSPAEVRMLEPECEVEGEYSVPRVGGQCVELGLHRFEGPARDATGDLYGATFLCRDCDDDPIFYDNWEEQYDKRWPYTRDGPHGALRNLISAHRAFGEAHCVEWIRECRIECWRRSATRVFLQRVCGTTTERIAELLQPTSVQVRTAQRPVDNREETRGTKRRLDEEIQ